MPQVMPPEVGPTCGLAGRVEHAVQAGRGKVVRRVTGSREQQPFAASGDVVRQVLPQRRHQMRRYRDVTDSGVALRGGDDELVSHPGDGAADADDPVRQVDVFAPQLGQLAVPQTAPAASNVMGWSRSGMASTRAASSTRSSVVILWTRLELPAPEMWHGLALISSSCTAVARIERSSE